MLAGKNRCTFGPIFLCQPAIIVKETPGADSAKKTTHNAIHSLVLICLYLRLRLSRMKEIWLLLRTNDIRPGTSYLGT